MYWRFLLTVEVQRYRVVRPSFNCSLDEGGMGDCRDRADAGPALEHFTSHAVDPRKALGPARKDDGREVQMT